MQPATRDIAAGATVAAIAAAVLAALPWQADATGGRIVTSASLPTWLAAVLLVLGLMLLASGLRARREVPRQADRTGRMEQARSGDGRRPALWVGLTLAIVLGYAMLLPWLGFVATSIGAMAALSLIFGGRNWRTVLLPALVLPIAVYLFFRYGMTVFLPDGRWFG